MAVKTMGHDGVAAPDDGRMILLAMTGPGTNDGVLKRDVIRDDFVQPNSAMRYCETRIGWTRASTACGV
jgi:hypothetical protein